MTELHSTPAEPPSSLVDLRRLRASRLRNLLKLRPYQRRYKQVLKAYLDAEGQLQKEILKSLNLH